MMNQDNPYAMNQTCKVCGEPAAGFHFGAFTCEGCKSFFGRSYNNLSSISDCKNNGECIINKKNRTACKACRLRKCLMVGMSKSGSRYGRRSNWFKIHCLLQEQQQQAAAAMAAHQNSQHMAGSQIQMGSLAGSLHGKPPTMATMPTSAAAAAALGMLGHAGPYAGLYQPRTKEELMMLSLEEYAKHPAGSPSVSSPDSHHSDSSVEVNGRTTNTLGLHMGGNKSGSSHGEATTSCTTINSIAGLPPPPSTNAHLRKEMSAFLPLSAFPALTAMPVMPPPNFLPPSHLLFPGYHPALYQHHAASLMKPSPEQQAAAAAVQQLFNSSPRFVNATSAAPPFSHEAQQQQQLQQQQQQHQQPHHSTSSVNTKSDNLRTSVPTTIPTTIITPPLPPTRLECVKQTNNNHLTNDGGKTASLTTTITITTTTTTTATAMTTSAEELTKRFYLDAVLKSQRQTSPPAPPSSSSLSLTTNTTIATKLPISTKHDHSITALVTPNSDSERERDRERDRDRDREREYRQRLNVNVMEKELMNPQQLTIINHHHYQSLHDSNIEQHSSSNGQEESDRSHSRSLGEDDDDIDEENDANDNVIIVGKHELDTDDEDVVVSMTPPRSPIKLIKPIDHITNLLHSSSNSSLESQDNPIDLSMKAISSVNSCHSSHSTTTHNSCSPELRETSFDDLEYKRKFFNNNNTNNNNNNDNNNSNKNNNNKNNNNNNNNNNTDKLDNECLMYKASKRKLDNLENAEENVTNKKYLGKDVATTTPTSMPIPISISIPAATSPTSTSTPRPTIEKSIQKVTPSPLDLTQKIL